MKIATAVQMRSIDTVAINDYGIPGIVLMEHAAMQAVNVIRQHMPSGIGVLLCGRGNNGGDGFAIARHLYHAGYGVSIAFFEDAGKLTPDARTNYLIAIKLGIPVITDTASYRKAVKSCDFVVDCLYGVGFRGSLNTSDAALASVINQSGKVVYAIDIPSGINADTGEIEGVAVRADICITFTAYKPAHLLFPAADHCGRVVVCDIGIPHAIMEQYGTGMQTIEKAVVAALLPKRAQNSHKGTYGKVFAVAGSTGMSGAAYLAATSAARTGAGLVTVGVPAGINSIIEGKTTEVMSIPLPDRNGVLAAGAQEEIIRKANASDVLLFGPGLSAADDIYEILKGLVGECGVPIIIDADGLNALSQEVGMLKRCKSPVVITPHAAEMARLLGISVAQVEQDRIKNAADFAAAYNAVVILKGAHTIVAAPEGQVHINMTGNAGMATGGSGDVLSGMVAALIAGGLSCENAAVCGVYLHGLAGDIAARELGMPTMLAGDMMNRIGGAMMAVSR